MATPDGTAIRDYIPVTDLVQGHLAALDWLERPGDVAVCYTDPGLARTALGWRAERSLDAMCRDVWNWQQSGSAA